MSAPAKITCVVPIYDGLEQTRRCLDGLAASLRVDDALGDIILVLDRPPHVDMIRLCTSFVEAWPSRIRLIENEANLGFVRSVNAALRVWEGITDVLLLNADAIVRPRTLSKLQRALYASSDVASACPLTSDESFLGCSYVSEWSGPHPADGAALDARCEVLYPRRTIEIPVGVGFCMLMRADVLRDIGPFDERFGRGYGEEVDWCLRARQRGFRHIAVLDAFVWHEGTGSFKHTEKDHLQARNGAIIESLHPDFEEMLKAYDATDPLGSVKAEIFVRSIDLTVPLVVSLSHNLGGGTQTYLSELIATCKQTGRIHLRIFEATGDPGYCNVVCDQRGTYVRFRSDRLPDVLQTLRERAGGLAVLCHSHLEVRRDWIDGLVRDDIPYTIMLHDYQWYCPRIDLIGPTRMYCGEPPPSLCDLCIKAGPTPSYPGSDAVIAASVDEWITANHAVLLNARKVIAPSASTAARYKAKFAGLDVAVLDHRAERTKLCIKPMRRLTTAEVTIAVVGGINVAKGCDWLLEMCQRLDTLDSGATVELIGQLENISEFDNINCFADKGRYQLSDLGALLDDSEPDFVLFPGSWPETYCFVLSEIWQAGLCPVAFDIGAIAERIRNTGAGILLEKRVSPEHFAKNIAEINELRRKLDGYSFSFGEGVSKSDYLDVLI